MENRVRRALQRSQTIAFVLGTLCSAATTSTLDRNAQNKRVSLGIRDFCFGTVFF
jgi:hypothetical protein